MAAPAGSRRRDLRLVFALLALVFARPVGAAPVTEVHYTWGPLLDRGRRPAGAVGAATHAALLHGGPPAGVRVLPLRSEQRAEPAQRAGRERDRGERGHGRAAAAVAAAERRDRRRVRRDHRIADPALAHVRGWPSPRRSRPPKRATPASAPFHGERRLRWCRVCSSTSTASPRVHRRPLRGAAPRRRRPARPARLGGEQPVRDRRTRRRRGVVGRGARPERRSALGTLHLRDRALSVSSVLRHQRRIGARRIGHIVDPRSGEPLTEPAAAVVVAASATDAEAWSKALLLAAAAARVAIVRGAPAITPRRAADRLDRLPRFPRTAPIPADAEPLR